MQNSANTSCPGGRNETVVRIHDTLLQVAELVAKTEMLRVVVSKSAGGDPVTTLDKEINDLIHRTLPRPDEGWLSEETKDDPRRLSCARVWVVDPIDGTREFIQGIPEWCVSISMVEGHEAVAGGVLNPSTGEMFLGSSEGGLEVIQLAATSMMNVAMDEHCVLVSRREHKQGKWDRFEDSALKIHPVGSIAYRLARVAAGYAAATCTFDPRSEWDVAGGVALVQAAGGTVQTVDGMAIQFNREVPKLPSFFAFASSCSPSVSAMLGATRAV